MFNKIYKTLNIIKSIVIIAGAGFVNTKVLSNNMPNSALAVGLTSDDLQPEMLQSENFFRNHFSGILSIYSVGFGSGAANFHAIYFCIKKNFSMAKILLSKNAFQLMRVCSKMPLKGHRPIDNGWAWAAKLLFNRWDYQTQLEG
ncbi:MAG TPA: hypothetical protein VLH61_06445 [Bacteroidales bacterium]|nr:hypothetical protein [Bacteroidales bacterium]